MPKVYLLPDTGGYMYHFLILELSTIRKFKILDNKNWVQQYLYQKFMAYILAHFKL